MVDKAKEDEREKIIFKVPPTPDVCAGHKAGCLMRTSEPKPGVDAIMCPCCDQIINSEPYSLGTKVSVLKHHGYGVSLLFTYIKNSSYMIAMLVAIAAIEIYFNWTEGYMRPVNQAKKVDPDIDDYYPFVQFLDRTTVANIERRDVVFNGLINIAVAIILYMGWTRYRAKINLKAQKLDSKEITPPDYTIMLDNMPAFSQDYDEEDFMTTQIYPNFPESTICRTCFSYNIGEHLAHAKKLNDMKRTQTIHEKVKEFQSEEVAKKVLPKKFDYHSLKAKHDLAFEEFKGKNEEEYKHAPLAFITFFDIKNAEAAEELFKSKPIVYQGNTLKVVKAPEPFDILWENLGYSNMQRNMRIFRTYMICLGLIVGIGIMNHFISGFIKGHLVGSAGEYLGRILTSIIVGYINYFLGQVISHLSKGEKHRTITDIQTSVGTKTSIAQTFNSVIVPLVINVIIGGGSFYNQKGYLMSLFFVWVMVGLINPLMDYPKIYFSFLTNWMSVKYRQVKGNKTQAEANVEYEPPPFKVSKEYAIVTFFVFFTAFCFPLFPMGSILTTLSLILQYWVNKHMALRVCKRPPKVSHHITLFFMDYSGISIIILLISNAIFTWIFGNWYAYVPAIIGGGLLILLIIMKYTCMKEGEEEHIEQECGDSPYDIIEFGKKDYLFMNPVTTKEALQSFLTEQIKISSVREQKFLKDGLIAVKRMEKHSGMQIYCLGKENAILRDLQPNPIPIDSEELKAYFKAMVAGEYLSPQMFAKAALSAGLMGFASAVAVKYYKEFQEDERKEKEGKK